MKNLIPLFSVVSILGAVVGYIFKQALDFGICVCTSLACNPACLNFYDRIGVPMFYGFGALAIIFLILWFIPKAIPAWKKFARWYVPIVALIFIFYPTHQSMDFISPSMGEMAQWFGGIYVGVSLCLIALSNKKR